MEETIGRSQWMLLIFVLLQAAAEARMEFKIAKTWDDRPLDHESTKISFQTDGNFIVMNVTAPFFNDPPAPRGAAGQPFKNLFDYEVVEAFFLGQDDKYLEVELSPHGQHLVLLLSGRRNVIKMCLPMSYDVSIWDNHWYGIARIPKTYFPPRIRRFNAYAIHGSGERRHYEALYPVPRNRFEQPDFHRLDYFGYLSFSVIFSVGHSLSDVWHDALENYEKGLTCEASHSK
ncbi:hypothetical protein X975_16775, partial [Stegodyphus mimosarum]